MTEDDTFRRLKREPFRKVFVACLDRVSLGDDIAIKHRLLIEESGWSVDEFRTKLYNEIIAKRITMDVAIVTDGEWQRKYLATGAI